MKKCWQIRGMNDKQIKFLKCRWMRGVNDKGMKWKNANE